MPRTPTALDDRRFDPVYLAERVTEPERVIIAAITVELLAAVDESIASGVPLAAGIVIGAWVQLALVLEDRFCSERDRIHRAWRRAQALEAARADDDETRGES
jgi:hypothetical protein